MSDKLKDIQQVETPTGFVDYKDAGWANKSYDFERPFSNTVRTPRPSSIELLVSSENYLHPAILNRPLIQLADNTLINKIVSSLFVEVIGQDGFFGQDDLRYDPLLQQPGYISLIRGRYVLAGKYVDLLNDVHNGKITTKTGQYTVSISGLSDGAYVLYLDQDGVGNIIRSGQQLPNKPLVKVGEFSITNGTLTGYVDKRNIITIGTAAITEIKNAINSLYWQNGVIDMTSTLPSNPSVGARYILTDEQSPHYTKICVWDGDGWTYISPQKGWVVYVISSDTYKRFDGTIWAPLLLDGTGMSLYGLREVFFIESGGQTEFELQNYTSENDFAKVVYKNGVLLTPKGNGRDNDYEIVVQNNVGILRLFSPVESGDIINVIYYQPASMTSINMKADKYGVDNIEIADSNKGIILRAPNGSRWRIRVNNTGNLMTESL